MVLGALGAGRWGHGDGSDCWGALGLEICTGGAGGTGAEDTNWGYWGYWDWRCVLEDTGTRRTGSTGDTGTGICTGGLRILGLGL